MTTVQTAPTIRGNSNVQKEQSPVPFIALSKNDMRKRFAAVLSATDSFLSQVVLAIEDVVDPHNERDLQQFFANMAKDNVVKNDLPKFAAGTGFSKTLNALSVLSVTATNACVPEMAKAAHNRQRSRTSVQPTSTRTSAQPTSIRTSAQPTSTPTDAATRTVTPTDASTPTVTPTDASTPTAADALGSYLRAARTPPRPITRMPSTAQPNRAPPITANTKFSAKLVAQATRMTETWVGHETKGLMEVTSDTALASPTHLRQILSFSGVRAPIAVIPTDDSTKVLVCAANSVLHDVQQSYKHFVAVSHSSRRQPPKLSFNDITDSAGAADNATAARKLLRATQKEIKRLEADNCTWRPKRFFAKRLREFERTFHARCVHFEGDVALALLPPFAPERRAHKRTHAEAASTDTTVTDAPSRMDITDTVEPSRQ